MTLAIVGSRACSKPQEARILEILASLPRPDAVVTGDATSVDAIARRWAAEDGIPLTVHAADWDEAERLTGNRKAAGPIRNQKIVAAADAVVAFLCAAESKGTRSTMALAKARGTPCEPYDLTPTCK